MLKSNSEIDSQNFVGFIETYVQNNIFQRFESDGNAITMAAIASDTTVARQDAIDSISLIQQWATGMESAGIYTSSGNPSTTTKIVKNINNTKLQFDLGATEILNHKYQVNSDNVIAYAKPQAVLTYYEFLRLMFALSSFKRKMRGWMLSWEKIKLPIGGR